MDRSAQLPIVLRIAADIRPIKEYWVPVKYEGYFLNMQDSF